MKCRHCQQELQQTFADLHHQPASNSFLSEEQLKNPEIYFPLKLFACDNCFLVQVDEYKNCEDIFSHDYVYFSSMSSSWLAHAKQYVDMMRTRFHLDKNSQVIEIASNDGYLLQYFKEANVPCFGIEPTSNTATAAREKGIESIEAFFGTSLATDLAKQNKKADLILGNNVLAHVPDINDFVSGLPLLLKKNGIVTFEFPHLLQLIEQNQFDTIYQEHYSYLLFYTVERVFKACNMRIFDVEELPTHGGSLRIFATHAQENTHKITPAVELLLKKEKDSGMLNIKYYQSFQQQIEITKNALLFFLLEKKLQNKKVVAYGAAAKGNTFLNLCGVKPDLISFCVDKAASKQGKFMPGSHIPVYSPSKIKETKPDYVFILPWNIKKEVMEEHAYIREWGAQFVTAIPKLCIQ